MRYFKSKELFIITSFYLIVTILWLMEDAVFYINIINPLFWGGMLIYLIWNIKKGYTRISIDKKHVKYMIIISAFHVAIFFYLGFILGFGKSPYSHKIISIFSNIITQVFPIIGIEMLRTVVINSNKKSKICLIFITILLGLLQINYHTLGEIIFSREELFQYTFSEILPIITQSILYTYLVLKGSYQGILIYRVVERMVIILLPILPNIDWFATASFNILSTLIIYLLFKYKFTKERQDIRENKKNLWIKISYLVTLVISVTIISFMLGLFKYEPITILSNSMSPVFNRGDVVIFKKLDEGDSNNILPKGSIIVYKTENKNIAHRIVNIIKNGDTVLYQTRGDSNNSPDTNLVQTDQIRGIYTFHIKYLGFPSIWLYDYFNDE